VRLTLCCVVMAALCVAAATAGTQQCNSLGQAAESHCSWSVVRCLWQCYIAVLLPQRSRGVCSW
jgi:hypothetical protein